MPVEFKELGSNENHRMFVITLEDGTVIDVLYSTVNGAVTTLNHGRVLPREDKVTEGIAENREWTAKEILDREA